MADAPKVPTKPLIFADNPFFDGRQDAFENVDQRWDASYVPGASEQNIENERRMAAGKDPLDTPRPQWVRIAGRAGDVNASDPGMTDWMSLGYRACGTDDLKANGWGMPPTAQVMADGTIRRGDLALFMVSGKKAQKNRVRAKAEREAVRENGPKTGTGEVYEVAEERVERKGSLKELSELPAL